MRNTNVRAWYTNHKTTLCYGDNRRIKVGKTHAVQPPIIMCDNGLHASRRLLDSIAYCQCNKKFHIYRVELSGSISFSSDKMAAESRKYLYEVNLDWKLLKNKIEEHIIKESSKDTLYSIVDQYRYRGVPTIYDLLVYCSHHDNKKLSCLIENIIKDLYYEEEYIQN